MDGSHKLHSKSLVLADFDGAEYGSEYLTVRRSELVFADLYSREESWIYVSRHGSESGWIPYSFLKRVSISIPESYREILSFFRSLLRTLFNAGHLLTEQERHVSHSSSDPFGIIENQGDRYLSQNEVVFANEVLERLQWTVLQDPCSFAGQLHSNIGLGPFFTEALGLLEFFWAEQWDAELLAGAFEATLGGLERAGCINVISGLVQYGMSIVMLASRRPHHILVDTLVDVMGNTPIFCMQHHCRLWVNERYFDHFGNHTLVQDHQSFWETITAEHRRLLYSTICPPVRFLDPLPVEAINFTRTHSLNHPNDPNIRRWVLKCVDCDAEIVTKWGRSDSECLAIPQTDGWGKASNNTWARSTRCPHHHALRGS